MSHIAVMAEHPHLLPSAQALADKLKLKMLHQPTEEYHAYLIVGQEGLALKLGGESKMKALRVDFLKGALAHRCQYGGGKSQLIAKAIGLKKGAPPRVLDVTAGLGRDAYVLAHLGCHVQLLERSPIIAALLEDGLLRATTAGNVAALNLNFIQTDALQYLPRLKETQKPEVIYIDPMFSPENNSALVKKEMRVLRAVVGEDEDSAQLLELALNTASKRVVVKRARLAACLNEIKPSFQVIGKSTRFDVYLINGK